ncbi:diacylglycerol/lipid kinase family protein [Wenxinia marina]|uniref:Sphingosine kinase and enzyme n=2 Tax=Wenxinia TaxID=653686 RepID=A0A0D0QFJ6_9RHOB|nr:diacylglycerol kinase family protein [Wenxinia marina]KIQ71072.1 Sphingosine kinase and enzyme [Wenxinia marina DSM 24838]GGL55068.1 diacylglycerol kinase [Wenxinia marina]
MAAARDGSVEANRIVVIRNRMSGLGEAARESLEAAIRTLGDRAEVVEVDPGDDIGAKAREAAKSGAAIVAAAGGDGTIMGVAQGLAGSSAALGVLPLGTFNFFARGLGLPEDAEEAARVLSQGRRMPMSLAAVDGQLFLNNVSMGIYPAILQEREAVYKSWGRSRLAAYWSVVKTFLKAQAPLKVTLDVDGRQRRYVTPLIFVARSAFQLEHFNLPGKSEVERDRLAIFVGSRTGRAGLFLQAWHLLRGTMKEGRDFDLLPADRVRVDTRRRTVLVACDGEKFRLPSPVTVEMKKNVIDVVVP